MEKIIKSKNIYKKTVNNLGIKVYHKLCLQNHIVNKDCSEIYKSLQSVYQELNDFDQVDLIDLKFYERWLNGRY